MSDITLNDIENVLARVVDTPLDAVDADELEFAVRLVHEAVTEPEVAEWFETVLPALVEVGLIAASDTDATLTLLTAALGVPKPRPRAPTPPRSTAIAAACDMAPTANKYGCVWVDDSGRRLDFEDVKRLEESRHTEIITTQDLIDATHAEDARDRRLALRELCPCHVKRDVDAYWDRIFEMAEDPSADVRYQAMHNLCDGSPTYRELDVIAALEKLHDDPCKKNARTARRILVHYRKTGDWNIM